MNLSPLDLIDVILQRRRDGLPRAVELPGTERLVLIAWVRHLDALDGTAYPSLDTLAREVGLSERPVRAAHKALREKGILVVVDTVGRGALRCRLDLTALLLEEARQDEPRCEEPRSNQPRSNQPAYPGRINRGTAVESTAKAGPISGSMEAGVVVESARDPAPPDPPPPSSAPPEPTPPVITALVDDPERLRSSGLDRGPELAELLEHIQRDDPAHAFEAADMRRGREGLKQFGVADLALVWDFYQLAPQTESARQAGWASRLASLCTDRLPGRVRDARRWHAAGRPTESAPARASPARASPRRTFGDAFADLGLTPTADDRPLRLVLPGDTP